MRECTSRVIRAFVALFVDGTAGPFWPNQRLNRRWMFPLLEERQVRDTDQGRGWADVRTPSDLPNTETVESMKLGAARVLRNPTIYTLFTRLVLVTGAGSSVYRAIEETTGREPQLLQGGNEFVYSIPRRNMLP